MKLAITGGTGFVGGHLLRLAASAGHAVRALARQPQPASPGIEWIAGALDQTDSLAALVEGEDAVIHVAGVVNAPDRDGFAAGNIAGTQAIVDAARAAGIRRFVHVSSLAAREPGLSDYGWSKAGAEDAVRRSGLDFTMVRPPAIYGPGDREMLELFRLAKRGLVPLPPGGRLSIVHVVDLARLLLRLADSTNTPGETLEPDDGATGGWDHRALARAIGVAVGRRAIPLPMPPAILRLGAFADGLVRGKAAKLTPDRVRYFLHPDWTVRHPPPPSLWQAEVPTPAGLKATAAWYMAQGWL